MNTALCFNDVLAYDKRPDPIVMRDGKYFLRLLEKGAGTCPREKECKTLKMWKKHDSMVHDYYYGITLSDLLNEEV